MHAIYLHFYIVTQIYAMIVPPYENRSVSFTYNYSLYTERTQSLVVVGFFNS